MKAAACSDDRAERQLRTLLELGARSTEADTAQQACTIAAATLANNPWDVPFAIFYLLDAKGERLERAAECGFDARPRAANPEVIALHDAASPRAWDLDDVVEGRHIEVFENLAERFDEPATGPWSESSHAAIALPLGAPDQPQVYGVLIAGLCAERALDEGYRLFLELAAGQVVTAIRNARACQKARPASLPDGISFGIVAGEAPLDCEAGGTSHSSCGRQFRFARLPIHTSARSGCASRGRGRRRVRTSICAARANRSGAHRYDVAGHERFGALASPAGRLRLRRDPLHHALPSRCRRVACRGLRRGCRRLPGQAFLGSRAAVARRRAARASSPRSSSQRAKCRRFGALRGFAGSGGHFSRKGSAGGTSQTPQVSIS